MTTGDVPALLARATALVGATVAEIGDVRAPGTALRTKGSAGAIVERALGASGGSRAVHDFPTLGLELKTVPLALDGGPLESTYVCTLRLADADRQEWATSWARAKLARVLFVPLLGARGCPWSSRRVGQPRLWSPTPAQEAVLRTDFDDAVGLIGIGRAEELTGHHGRWLQVRPKARDGAARTVAWGADGERIETVPRGLYLRARFVGAILADPAAMPE